MKLIKEKKLKDLRTEIIEGKRRYLIETMKFRQRLLEQKERINKSRKKKKLY